MSKFGVASLLNQYKHHNNRGDVLFYHTGPASPGGCGTIMYPNMYFDTEDEIKRIIPILEMVYWQGKRDRGNEIRRALSPETDVL